MANWRFGAFPKLPYSTMQQLNLDWILDRIRRFLPDTGTKGQVLTRTKDGAAWVDPEAASGAVSSVNGKTGDVVLTASDVGALPSSYVPPAAPVQSVNGQTGAVQLTIPDSTSDLTNDSGFITAAQAAAAAPVQSVNDKTGAVVLGAADVGALPNDYVPPINTETRTYVNNSYIDETAFNRCTAYSIGNIGFFIINLSVSSTSVTSDFVTIGTTSLRPYSTPYATLPMQNTTQNASILITSTGLVRFYKGNNSTGFIRTVLAFPIVKE